MTSGKTIALTRRIFVNKVMSLLLNMLSRLVITSLLRSKHLLISWPICSDFGAQKNKVSHCFYCFPSICHEVVGLDAMILVFWMLSFKPTFSFCFFTFIKRLFSSSSLSAIRVVSSAYLKQMTLVHSFFDGWVIFYSGFPGGSDGKKSACNAGSIPGSGKIP